MIQNTTSAAETTHEMTSSIQTLATTTIKSTIVSNQDFKISWKDSKDSTDIEMTYVLENTREAKLKGSYFAFGLSNDKKMV